MDDELGVSLIELVVSLFILSILLLGLDAVQITSLHEAKKVYFFSVAAQQLSQMAERLMACKGNNMDAQLTIWNRQNARVLPQGRGIVSGSHPDYVITIFWGKAGELKCHQNKIGPEGCLKLAVTINQ